MLIGICGSICAGKHTTAEYLVQHHGFLRLHLPSRIQLAGSRTEDEKRLLPSVTDQKGTRGLTFPDVDALIDFVTKRWREHWVLTDIYDEATCLMRALEPMALGDFVVTNDFQLYGSSPATVSTPNDSAKDCSHLSARVGIAHLLPQAHLQILNQQLSIPEYWCFLDSLELPSPIRLRPTWDAYFMTLASLASLRSNCMKRRVGCVLVHNSRIISTGYNGTPRNLTNCNEGGCGRCNSANSGGVALSTCLCLHAEENALLEAGRERIREGAILYCDTCPCLTCSVKIAQVGVKEVVYSQGYNMDDASRQVLKEAGVELRQFSPPRSGLVSAGTRVEPSQDLVALTNGRDA
ncbi:hypothetical protein DV737_g5594, partial [Chaetothyriales sp. CBS 132003]